MLTDYQYQEDTIWYRPGWTFYPKPATMDGLVQMKSNLKIVHAGSGTEARTMIVAYGPQSSNYSQLLVSGHYELDGIDIGESNNAFLLYLKPATKLNLGDIGSIDGGSGSGSAQPGGDSTYSVYSSRSSVGEGEIVLFTIDSANSAAGKTISYTITGIASEDVVGGQLSGKLTMGSDGKAYVSIAIAADSKTEGPKTAFAPVRPDHRR